MPDLLPLVWTDWPARQMPRRAAAAGLVILLSMVLLGSVDPWLVPLAALVLVGATAEALLPTRYRVDEQGAAADRLLSHRVLRWERVARIQTLGPDILLCSKRARPWLARRHDLRLRQPPAAVLAYIRGRFP